MWRDAARMCLAKDVAPGEVSWLETAGPTPPPEAASRARAVRNRDRDEPPSYFRVPKPFLELARLASCHRDRGKWELLYRALWRITHGERNLLEMRIDHDVYRLEQLAEAVRRDARRMQAAVRFHRLDHLPGDNYVAWHASEHHTLRLVAPFFAQRFRMFHWALFTPDESAFWNGKTLEFGPGAPLNQAPTAEQLAKLWHARCPAKFSAGPLALELRPDKPPTRLGTTAAEARLWENVLDELPRTSVMAQSTDRSRRGAEDFLPDRPGLPALRRAARHCEGCDLYKNATQTVFGEGPADARVMFIGEQPGNEEDITGHPFVGPAGQVFNDALIEAGLDRNEVYVTNAVKHFKNTPRGKRRVHAKPTRGEVLACRAWLESEIMTIEPPIVVCLGATAAQSLMGSDFRITKQRGEFLPTDWSAWTIATYHPSALLRAPDEDARAKMNAMFQSDLKKVAVKLHELEAS